MARPIWPVFLLLCACGGTTVGREPPAPVPPPGEGIRPPEPEVVASQAEASTTSPPAAAGKPSPLQVVSNELAKAGWSCWPLSVELPTLHCPADATHPVAMRVGYTGTESGCSSDDPCMLTLTSFDAPRKFGTPCEKLEDATNDLTNVAHHFSVICNDTTNEPLTSQSFGFVTTIKVTDPSAPGVAAALPMHRADREAAIRKLESVKAIVHTRAAASKGKGG